MAALNGLAQNGDMYAALAVGGGAIMSATASTVPPKKKTVKERKRIELSFKTRHKVELFRILKHKEVESYEIVNDRLFLVTTRELLASGYRIGAYDILVDFVSKRINISNITKRAGGGDGGIYDGPCISNTRPCWGNLENDIYRDIGEEKIADIVYETIEFLKTGHTGHPYLTLSGFYTRATMSGKKILSLLGDRQSFYESQQTHTLAGQYDAMRQMDARLQALLPRRYRTIRYAEPQTGGQTPRPRGFFGTVLHTIKNFFRGC